MNEYSQPIKRELDGFLIAVQKLSAEVRGASTLWKDPKYSELSSELAQVAGQSRTVLLAGDKSCNAIDKFFDVAGEEY